MVNALIPYVYSGLVFPFPAEATRLESVKFLTPLLDKHVMIFYWVGFAHPVKNHDVLRATLPPWLERPGSNWSNERSLKLQRHSIDARPLAD
jgi:hypothetical protein